jgi:hypothetical protein
MEKRNAYRILVGKPEGKRPPGRPRRRWVDNIKMDLMNEYICLSRGRCTVTALHATIFYLSEVRIQAEARDLSTLHSGSRAHLPSIWSSLPQCEPAGACQCPLTSI